MVRVPRVHEGEEAVLRVIFRRRLTARPLVSAVSRPEVDTEEMMPLIVKECPSDMEHKAGLAMAA